MAENMQDLSGSSQASFSVGGAAVGTRLKASGNNLVIRNFADAADAQITASQVNISGDVLVFNSDASEAGADWKLTLQRAASGMTANVTFTLPPDDGTPGQVLQTDGSGVLTWASAGTTADCWKTVTKEVNFGDSSTITFFTLPADAVSVQVNVVIDTPFDGTAPTLSVGVNGGSASKFMTATKNNLKAAAGSNFAATACMALTPDGSTQDIEIAYSADSSAAGVARVSFTYMVPTAA